MLEQRHKRNVPEIDKEDSFYGLNVENISKIKRETHSNFLDLEEQTILEEINTMPKLGIYKTLQTNLSHQST